MNRLVLVIAILTGCTTIGDGTEPQTDDLPPPHSEAALSNNERTAFNYFVSKGLTQVQAAGIVGNLMQESSVIPTAVEFGGGPGRGIAQWSVGGRFDRGANSLTAFASARGASRWALGTQLDFIWYELATVGGYGLPELSAATTLSAAVYAFQSKYEVCGTCASAKRLTYAQQALTDFGTTGTTTPPPVTTTCYSSTLGRDMPQNACVQSAFDDAWYQCSNGSWVDRWSDPDACNGEYPL